MKKKISKSKNTLQTITVSAQREFAKNGFDKTTVRDIAEGAQVNVATIYYYFKTKEELHEKVLEEGFSKLSTLLKKKLNTVTEPEDKIFSVISTYIHFFHTHKNMQRIILREMVSGGVHLDMIISKYISKSFNFYKSIISEGIEKRTFRNCDPSLSVLSLMGMIFHFCNFEPIYIKLMGCNKKESLIKYLPAHIYNIFITGIKRR